MSTSGSVQKAARVAERKRSHNRSIRSTVKTSITKAEKLISSREAESARAAVVAAISALDKAVVKGVIHPNNAARHKSRLMKKLQSLGTESPGTEPVDEPA